jgi:hypothetical protein
MQGSPKGHPSVTQRRPKRRLTVRFLFSTKAGKRPGGGGKTAVIAVIAVIADIARDQEKQTLTTDLR